MACCLAGGAHGRGPISTSIIRWLDAREWWMWAFVGLFLHKMLRYPSGDLYMYAYATVLVGGPRRGVWRVGPLWGGSVFACA